MKLRRDVQGFLWSDNGPETSDDLLAFGGHEPNVLVAALGLMNYGGVFVDVGAHVGLYTLNILPCKPRKVFAIEANPATVVTLRENIRINAHRAPPGTIEVLPFAAWDEEAHVEMTGTSEKASAASAQVRPAPEEISGIRARRLDDMLPSGTKVDLIKIDVEGAEARVLRGAARVLETDHPRLLIEMHDELLGDTSIRTEVEEELSRHGYTWTNDLRYSTAHYFVCE